MDSLFPLDLWWQTSGEAGQGRGSSPTSVMISDTSRWFRLMGCIESASGCITCGPDSANGPRVGWILSHQISMPPNRVRRWFDTFFGINARFYGPTLYWLYQKRVPKHTVFGVGAVFTRIVFPIIFEYTAFLDGETKNKASEWAFWLQVVVGVVG